MSLGAAVRAAARAGAGAGGAPARRRRSDAGGRRAAQAPLGPFSSHHLAMRTCISSTETSSMTADSFHWYPNGSSILPSRRP
ncbi:uncharacterized protein SOCE836_075700 [Sorangium cellulosum]|uniref:Uncharacterized protein n=1 Tax=Sorangium cellulosum TaxID=56 RepID=A0A4P2QXW3_SORCE|nr:uncharacterized protein SOCE836_075700 [Sorangium cellulosum]WCQ94682.1 hypothetical protein NQZ70_07450 [Sorangium sp. Soce836]